jgi:hypothetical protein
MTASAVIFFGRADRGASVTGSVRLAKFRMRTDTNCARAQRMLTKNVSFMSGSHQKEGSSPGPWQK